MADVSLTIIGLRRVGVSVGLALKRYLDSPRATHRFVITGSDREQDAGKEAEKLGAIDRYIRNLGDAVAGADIVFIDATLTDLRAYLQAIGPLLKAGCVVLEAAPLKQPPIEWAARYLPESAYLVGLAPVINPDLLYTVAADEPGAASAELFDNGNLYIAPAPSCPSEAVQLASDWVQLLGLEPHYLEPAEHDGFVAAVELLPMALGLTQFNVVTSAPSWADLRRLTNPPFALSTVSVLQNPADLADLVEMNRENLLHYVDQAVEQLAALRATLSGDDTTVLKAALGEASSRYVQWLSQRETGDWQDRARVETPTLRSSFLQGLFGNLFTRGKKDED